MSPLIVLFIFAAIAAFVLMDKKGLPFMRQKIIVFSVYFFGVYSGLLILYFSLKSFFGKTPFSPS